MGGSWGVGVGISLHPLQIPRGVGLLGAAAADPGLWLPQGPIGSRCEKSFLGVSQKGGSAKVTGCGWGSSSSSWIVQEKVGCLFFLNSVLYLCMSAVCWRTVFQQFLLLSVLASGNIFSLCNLLCFQGCFSSLEISPVLLFYPCARHKLRWPFLCTAIRYMWISGNANSQNCCDQVCVLCTISSDWDKLGCIFRNWVIEISKKCFV